MKIEIYAPCISFNSKFIRFVKFGYILENIYESDLFTKKKKKIKILKRYKYFFN